MRGSSEQQATQHKNLRGRERDWVDIKLITGRGDKTDVELQQSITTVQSFTCVRKLSVENT